jgi:hypothetical protein
LLTDTLAVEIFDECSEKTEQLPSTSIDTTQKISKITNKQTRKLNTSKKCVHSVNTIQEIIKWCEENSIVPEDEDKVFCGAFEHKIRKNNTLKYMRIFVTTIRLVSFMKENPDLLATDATRKSNWKGFSLILMGTNDVAKQFHPFGLLLSLKAKKKDFKFGFKALSTLCRRLNDQMRYKPSKLLADNSSTITKAFKKQFKYLPNKRIVCWTHALRNWDGK